MHLLSLHAACRSWTSSIQLVQSRSNSFSSAMCHHMDPKDFAGIWDTYCVRKTNHFNFTYALTARVVGALQVTSQPASSILLCSPLPSWTRRIPDLHIPLVLSSHLFVCLPCLLPSFTAPCKMIWARHEERETCPYHFSLRLFTMGRRCSYCPIASF